MLKLDISSFIFLYVLFSVIVTISIWVVHGYRKARRFQPKDVEFIWKCSICLAKYIDSKREDISVCPQCGSYNKREDTGNNLRR